LYDKAGAMAAMGRLHQAGDSPPAQRPSVSPHPDLEAEEIEQDPAERDRSVSLLSSGSITVLACQLLYLLLDLKARGWAMARLPLELHLTSVTVAALILGASTLLHGSNWLRRNWCGVAFVLCGTVMSVTAGLNRLGAIDPNGIWFFATVSIFASGTGVLLPWGPRWQAAYNIICLVDFAIGSGSPLVNPYGWLGMSSAVAVSQSASIVNERFRRAVQHQVAAARASE
jgi:hypothetical protein